MSPYSEEPVKESADDALVLKAVDKLTTPRSVPVKDGEDKLSSIAPQAPTKNQIQQHTGISYARIVRSVDRLLERGQLEEVEVIVWRGRGGKVKSRVTGYSRKPWGPATNPTKPTNAPLADWSG